MVSDPQVLRKAEALLLACRSHGITLAVAESCTGGLLSATLTEIAGCSDVFIGGAITYSNKSKHDVLKISTELINEFGAVSKQVANSMASQAAAIFQCELAVGITGIAGPSGGTNNKPVGTVHLATCYNNIMAHRACHFSGSRSDIRLASVAMALSMLLETIGDSKNV
ncbi:MAG: CinA family protein [Alphaproteobacteria bacterium]|nr:CinA family protein [Alphaproteobacteria bacterium]